MFPGLAYPEGPARSRISSLRRCVPKSPHARGDPPADTLSASDQLSLGKPAPPNGHPSFPSPSTFPSWRKPCGWHKSHLRTGPARSMISPMEFRVRR